MTYIYLLTQYDGPNVILHEAFLRKGNAEARMAQYDCPDCQIHEVIVEDD